MNYNKKINLVIMFKEKHYFNINDDEEAKEEAINFFNGVLSIMEEMQYSVPNFEDINDGILHDESVKVAGLPMSKYFLAYLIVFMYEHMPQCCQKIDFKTTLRFDRDIDWAKEVMKKGDTLHEWLDCFQMLSHSQVYLYDCTIKLMKQVGDCSKRKLNVKDIADLTKSLDKLFSLVERAREFVPLLQEKVEKKDKIELVPVE